MSMGLAGALRGGEEVSRSLGALGSELAEEAIFPDHFKGVPKAYASVVFWVPGIEGGNFSRFVDEGEEVLGPGARADSEVAAVEVGGVEVPEKAVKEVEQAEEGGSAGLDDAVCDARCVGCFSGREGADDGGESFEGEGGVGGYLGGCGWGLGVAGRVTVGGNKSVVVVEDNGGMGLVVGAVSAA